MSRRRLGLSRPHLTVVALAALPLLALALFVVLPVAGMIGRGFAPDGRLDVAGVLEVLGRPRVHRVLWFTVWSAGLATIGTLGSDSPDAAFCGRSC